MSQHRIDFAVVVWGGPYIRTFLSVCIPSLLSPGNLPACARNARLRLFVVTRPEDVAQISGDPAIAALSELVEFHLVPALTPDLFESANRYGVMAWGHRRVIAESLRDRSILCALSPDWVMADGTLANCLRRVEEGYQAIELANTRAVLEPVVERLEPYRRADDGNAITIPSRALVDLAVDFPHEITELCLWRGEFFSAFPSTIYWRVGDHSLLGRHFHVHPLFIDLAHASSAVERSASIDGTLLSLSQIPAEKIYVCEDSDEMCVVELSSRAHDMMGAKAVRPFSRTLMVLLWAFTGATREHRRKFNSHVFRFRGKEDVDWEHAIRQMDRDTAGLRAGLLLIPGRDSLYRVIQIPIRLLSIGRHFALRVLSRLRRIFD